jgi:flagellar basal-body rod protein FlgB
MTIGLFRDPTIQAIGAYMTRLSQREQIIASNVANINTPGFKTKDVSFYATMEELLSDNSLELRNSNSDQVANLALIPTRVQPFEEQGLVTGANQNNVDLDNEMLKMSKTSFGYALISQMLKGKFRTLASSINEGRS